MAQSKSSYTNKSDRDNNRQDSYIVAAVYFQALPTEILEGCQVPH